MSLFGRKSMNSDEYEKLAKRITNLEGALDRFTAKFMSLRGLIHRKGFADLPKVEEESEEEIGVEGKPKSIKDGVFLPDPKGIAG